MLFRSEASRKLRMNPREIMRVAQGLYENVFITYMRTNSTVLSGQAVAAARAQASSPSLIAQIVEPIFQKRSLIMP